MNWLQSLSQGMPVLQQGGLVAVLVLARVAAMTATFPLFGGPSVPIRVRAIFVFAVTLLVLPLVWQTSVPSPRTLIDAGILLAVETLLGLAVGLSLSVLFAGVQIAGQAISQMAGLSISEVINPGFDDSVPVYSLFLYMLATAVFFTLGGHVVAYQALLESFTVAPIGQSGPQVLSSLARAISLMVGQSFILGIRAGAPAIAALLLATIVLALVGRTMPQFNAFALGFGINALVTLGTLSLTLGAVAWLFQEEAGPALRLVLHALRQDS
jgi:flagellar biosynthetic protein FliR